MQTRWLAIFLVVFGCVAFGCGGDSDVGLRVDLRTDLRPGLEFTAVTVQIDGRAEPPLAVFDGQSFFEGERVLTLEGLAKAAWRDVRLQLRDDAGTMVAERSVTVSNRRDAGVTITISRNCRGVMCPLADGDPAISCLGGGCVEPTCLTGTEPSCPAPLCTSDAECTAASMCATGRCVDGTCLVESDDDPCDEGFVCHPDDGCVPAPADDASVPDASVPDSSVPDVPVDVPFDTNVVIEPPAEPYVHYLRSSTTRLYVFAAESGTYDIDILPAAGGRVDAVAGALDGQATLITGLARLEVYRVATSVPSVVFQGKGCCDLPAPIQGEAMAWGANIDDPRTSYGNRVGLYNTFSSSVVFAAEPGELTVRDSTGTVVVGPQDLLPFTATTISTLLRGMHVFESTGRMAVANVGMAALAGVMPVQPLEGAESTGFYDDTGTRFLVPDQQFILFNAEEVDAEVVLSDLDGTNPQPVMTLPAGDRIVVANAQARRIEATAGRIMVWSGSPGFDDWSLWSVGRGGTHHVFTGTDVATRNVTVRVFAAYDGTVVQAPWASDIALDEDENATGTVGADESYTITSNFPVVVEVVNAVTSDDQAYTTRPFNRIDDDFDGVPTAMEDANRNGDPYDDDADGDGVPAFLDPTEM